MNQTKQTFETTIRGIFTFEMSEILTDVPEIGFIFDGKKWVRVSSLEEAKRIVADIRENVFFGSARAEPTGFATIANREGYVCAESSPNGRIWALAYVARWEGMKRFDVAGQRIHISELELTRKNLTADRRAMNRACGYDK